MGDETIHDPPGRSDDPTIASPPGQPAPATDLPQSISGYRILRKIGEGGMGIVYEAERLFREALAMDERILGRDDPEIATSLK